jgi:hypothetical protein
LDKLIDVSFGERSVKGKLSKFKIRARLEGAPGFCDLGDRNRFESVFTIVFECLDFDTTATVRVILCAYTVKRRGTRHLRFYIEL